MTKLKVGDVVVGKVTGVETYGIFVNIDGYNGLVHISEISENFVRNVNDYAKIGDEIKVKVLEINESNHQLKLSIKDFENENRKPKREKIVETSKGFSSLSENLEEWVNIKMNEITSKK